jgi:hypothetical protein
MEYYFTEDAFTPKGPFCSSTTLKYLKKNTEKELNKIKSKIEASFNLNLGYAWVSKATFGAVFIDHTPKRQGPSVLGSHKKLFEMINGDVRYLVLSNKITRNFMRRKIDDFEVLAINIDSYKLFMSSFKDQEQRVRLYLHKLTKSQEEIIKNWILTKPTEDKKETQISQEDFLEYLSNLNMDSIEKFNSFFERINVSIQNNIKTNIEMYQRKLDEFKGMINQDAIHETKLSDFLHKNIWLLDFRYQKLDKCEHQFETPVGDVDIYLSKESLNLKNDVVIELKLPKDKIIKLYRDKPAITASVGNAISQIINYMESIKEPYKVLNGILILGRKKDDFIKILEQYLSQIKVITYEEIAENCQNVIDAFKLA